MTDASNSSESSKKTTKKPATKKSTSRSSSSAKSSSVKGASAKSGSAKSASAKRASSSKRRSSSKGNSSRKGKGRAAHEPKKTLPPNALRDSTEKEAPLVVEFGEGTHEPPDFKPEYRFNFKAVKDLATAGSWRRGYGYLKSNQVKQLTLTNTGVKAKVKGNFKEAYETSLHFLKEKVSVECSCPLKEEWCKHGVAVALEAVENKLLEHFFALPMDKVFVEQNVVEVASEYMGSYRVFLSQSKKRNKISLKLLERESGRLVKQIEPLLMHIIELQNEHGYEFNEATKREITLIKSLYQWGQMQTKDGWYHLSVSTAKEVFEILAELEEVCTPQHERMTFELDEPLPLVMSVNVSLAGNVLVSLHWYDQEREDVYPLEEMQLFAPNSPFGLYKNRLYRLKTSLNRLPKKLLKNTFTDIRDADGGKFMYEDLPRLRKHLMLDEADVLHQMHLKQEPPNKLLNIEMFDPALLKIRVSLDFSYDGVVVPYSKGAPSTPYVMVIKKSEEKIYWVKRDIKQEQAAYQALLDRSLDPLQTHYLYAEGDDAIDFYNTAVRDLGEDWELKPKEGDNFDPLKVSEHPLKVWAAIDFDDSVDLFRMKIFCKIGDQLMDIDDVRDQMIQGKKYFFKPGAGYVEIPLATILQFNRTLMALEAEKLEDEDGFDVYRVETFKAGLIKELTEQGVELELSEKFGKFWQLITSTSTIEDIDAPDNVQAELRPYQRQGFNWLQFLYTYGLNGILADDMGLGKTLQTLTLLQFAKNQDGAMPSLVVCPSSVVYNWVSEAKKFVPDLNILELTGSDRHHIYRKLKDADVVVTSYAIMRRDVRALKEYQFRHVILDESQNIKNWESQTAKAAKRLKAHHRLALSGTPIENRLLELWSVFDFLMPKFLFDVDEFKYRYVNPIEERANVDAERRLKKQVTPFLLRRLKQDVAKDLPPKIENVSYCDLTESQQELYLDFLENARDEVLSKAAGGGVGKNANSIFSALVRLRQICCHPQLVSEEISQGVNESGKFNALKSMVREIVAEGHRILIYSQFVEMLKIMRSWLEVEGIQYEYLTGETPSNKRGPIVDRFNNNDDIPVFLISLKAGGTGLNLTGADYVILYDPWWNPAAEDQAADRAHRIGQTKTVMVYRMVAKGTVEEKIMKLKDRKQDLVDSIISADRNLGSALTFEDLKDILTPDF